MRDVCDYVNVFQGCGEINLPKPEGIAARWFFIKAGCGNTSPAASLPFSAVSVGPFSGGYPTGYTDHMPNSHSRPRRFPGGKGLLGFAHLQQSGMGAIGYYYNYAVVTPRYAHSPERRVPVGEEAAPGYYAATLEDIRCELTVSGRAALHRYTFGSSGGEAVVDFTNNGVNIPNWGKQYVYDLCVTQADAYAVTAAATVEGIKVYFAARANAPVCRTDTGFTVAAPQAGPLLLWVSLSPVSEEKALARVNETPAFDTARANAREAWNAVL